MPVRLNNALKNTKNVYDLKYFANALTGNGKDRGLVNQSANPALIDSKKTTSSYLIADKATVTRNGATTIRKFPIDVFPTHVWQDMESLPLDKSEAVKIGKFDHGDLYMTMEIHSFMITESGRKASDYDLTTTFRCLVWAETDASDTEFATDDSLFSYQKAHNVGHNTVSLTFTCNPKEDLPRYLKSMENRGYQIDHDAFDKFMNTYSTYDHGCKASEIWQTKMDKVADFALDRLQNAIGKGAPVGVKSSVNEFIEYLSTYPIGLDAYKDIFNSIQKYFLDMVDSLCEDNLDLLLNDVLYKLGQTKSTIALPKKDATGVEGQGFNKEQLSAIEEPSTLTLIQAGAGTGKSTVVLGRIQYMLDSGVNPEDIMVLSFSNAAADNIVERNPEVHSQTIASMLKEIYDLNYPGHSISGIQTLRNSLAIWYPNDQTAYQFSQALWEVKDSKAGAITRLNSFVKQHFDKVIDMLNKVGQTCFELQIIICYQKIDSLKEPDTIKSKHLIIDEVQDNSIFEFIFALEYVRKHNESLFIVGDSSQTLYEFRGADPRALNMLEASGVFETHKLELNYRSNQNILDFANVMLEALENNQFANIQLKANARMTVTKDSFKSAVQMHYYPCHALKDIDDKLVTILNGDAKKFILDAYDRGEQVAFLAYAGKQVRHMMNIVQQMVPDANCVSLIPEKPYETTFFSSFIKKFWDEVEFLPIQNLIGGIASTIINHFDDLQRTSARDHDAKLRDAQTTIREWKAENAAAVNDAVMEYTNGVITRDAMYQRIKMTLIDFEIEKNSARSNAVNNRNAARKENQSIKDADFLFSTVHSVKGLEFDNVVLLYKNSDNSEECNKRMYYVGLTRAKNSEFIIAYDKVQNAEIKIAFDDLVDQLPDDKTAGKVC